MKRLNLFINVCIAMLLCIISFSCSQQHESVTPQETIDLGVSVDHVAVENSRGGTTTFSAMAMILHCHGENIRFGGDIENMEKTTIDKNGKAHYLRQFVAKGMEGWGVDADGKPTGTHYDVVGGAEMFSVQYDPAAGPRTPANATVFIHRGTLVFVNSTTGERVVARHTITKIPSSETVVNQWECGGK